VLDVTGGSLTGTVTVGADGKAVIPVSLVADNLTEGPEILMATVQAQSASVTVNDTSTTPAPTYAISASPTSVNEGSAATFTVATTNVASGTQLSYTLSGAGITAGDITGGFLSGTTSVDANGQATFTVNLAADQLTEGAEALTVTVQGQTSSVTVNDTSTAPAPIYAISASPASVNEGSAATFTVTTTNVASGTQLSYSLSGAGITTSDVVGGQLAGTTTVGANGQATFTVNVAADQLTEGAETLTATVQGQSASVTVNDSSTTSRIVLKPAWIALLGDDQGYENIRDFTITADGAIYGCGETSSWNFNGQLSNGPGDIFLTKFREDGSVVWTQLISGGGNGDWP
jgi:hypothetical protein